MVNTDRGHVHLTSVRTYSIDITQPPPPRQGQGKKKNNFQCIPEPGCWAISDQRKESCVDLVLTRWVQNPVI